MPDKERIVFNKGKFDTVKDSEVQYEFESPDQFFGLTQTMIPMANAVSAARNFYGHKFQTQAVPLTFGEAPYVQNLKDPNTNLSFQEDLGKYIGNVYADENIEVTKVTPDYIEYKNTKGEKKSKDLYNNFIYNRKSYLSNIPNVKEGDKIKAGSLLAHTNYTDKNGTINMGVNARVGLVPYKGWSMDDAVVISSDFAKKLTSEHAYQYTEDDSKNVKTSKDHYISLFPKAFNREQLASIDENGIVKPGTVVTKGSPLILSTKPRLISSQDSSLGRLSKYLKGTRSDASITWDKEDEGIVTDVIKGKNGYRVIVNNQSPAKVGDKVIERSGSKGTISQIIPVDQMPRTKDGKPLDILINDLSIPSRQNAALMYEILLGKIAEKTGKHYKLPTFQTDKEGKWYDFVQKELNDNGLTDVEDIYDPILDRTLEKPITVGNVYVQKLHHMGESKLSARGQGIYDNNLMPSKGGDEGQQSKKLSGLETSALLSAGAYNIIKDANSLRGQKNDDYWRAVREGKTPSLTKQTPFVWNKLLALMQGAGIQATDKGNGKLRLAPFTDKGLERLNPIELSNGEIVSLKDLKPVDGGLFDPTMALTSKWGKITLDEPIINPPFENHVASLLGIKKSDLESIIKGEKDLDKFGTGSVAIKKALASIDMRNMFNSAVKDFKEGPKTGKQKALNRMNYIKGLLRNDMKPEDLMISAIPVIPSVFRPYAIMGDTFLPGDINELYKEVFNVNQAQKELKAELGENIARENSIHLYKAIKALYGLEDPENKKLKQRDVSGFMQKLVGGTAKFSYPQRVLNSKNVDFSGRSVIDPNPELDMDEIGIPYEIGWKIFSPYIQRELIKQGMSLVDAIKEIENKSNRAKTAMEKAAESQYILYSRAPAWHKHNLLGGKAKFHDGKAILINPVVSSGLNADYDGDAQWGFVYILQKLTGAQENS